MRNATGRGRCFAASASVVGLVGCVASIRQDPLYGPARPTMDAAPGAVTEREPADVVIHAARRDQNLDVSVERTTSCRDVAISPRVRDVTLRRSFVDDAQEWDLALALVSGAGAGALQYAAEQIDCPSGSACWSATISGQYALLALAAIPLGFAVYNALRVRDGHAVIPAAPAVHTDPWRTCSLEPAPHEPLVVTIGTVELTRVTDAQGHAMVELASVPPLPDGTRAQRAIVHRAGSVDVVIDWSVPAPAPPALPSPPPD